ncbi:MAG: hypothetical protein J6Q14_03745 [Oscillospiraceae bacterium]|nr:hypothetical protein [Oscillospiraceae bacterium]
MKIPSEVRIAGVDYLVAIREGLNDGETMLRGQIQFDKSYINLNPNQGHQQMSQTLIHEVLHGIFYHYGIELEEKKEEEVVERLTHGLYQVLQDNARKLFDIVPEVTG